MNKFKNYSGEITTFNTTHDGMYLDSYMVEDSELTKIVKNAMSIYRTSKEYTSFVSSILSLKSNCSVFPNINIGGEVTIELHHHPFTLFDIFNIILYDGIKKNKDMTTLDLVQSVHTDHMNGLVTVIPLCKTVHDLYHSYDNDIKFPLNILIGDLTSFIVKYKEVLTTDHLEKVKGTIGETHVNDIIEKLKVRRVSNDTPLEYPLLPNRDDLDLIDNFF